MELRPGDSSRVGLDALFASDVPFWTGEAVSERRGPVVKDGRLLGEGLAAAAVEAAVSRFEAGSGRAPPGLLSRLERRSLRYEAGYGGLC